MKKASFFSLSLGRDFWNFRVGQLVSLLGDSCSNIALAWWVLEKTQSAAAIGSIFAPAMIVQIFLLPILGPFGDRYSRKTLIVIADAWRFVFSAILTTMVLLGIFNLPVLIVVYACISAGSALFSSVSSGIVPQLVDRENLPLAAQQTHAVNSFASVLGGVLGGLIVSVLGVVGAFAFDTFSYLIGIIFTLRIRANTTPVRAAQVVGQHPLRRWMNELLNGFSILHKIPVLFWVCMIAMVVNLGFSPLAIALPVLAKQARGMPAWYLGALESSIGLGAIIGAMTLTRLQVFFRPHVLFTCSIMSIGAGIALVPWVPSAFLPLIVLFWIGMAGTWTNVLLGTQMSLTVPDNYRARIGSVMGFVCNGISPLGLAGAGFLIAGIGLSMTMLAIGMMVVLVSPLLFLIPGLQEFLSVEPSRAGEFFKERYAGAFGDTVGLDGKEPAH